MKKILLLAMLGSLIVVGGCAPTKMHILDSEKDKEFPQKKALKRV